MLIERIYDFFYKILDIVFPEPCKLCNKFLFYPERLFCKGCLDIIINYDLKKMNHNFLYINKIWYILHYHNYNLSDIIIESKLRYRKNVLVYIIKYIKNKIYDLNLILEQIDIIIPVPLTKKKYKDRGFNQSELISKYCFDFSKKIKVDLLHKIKNTKDQKQLESEERSRNLVNAFELSNKEIIQGKRILIVDDVITTGSTIKTVAELLVKSGCKEVNVFSLFKV